MINKLINFGDYNAHSIGVILLWLAAFLTLYTGYDYVRKGINHAMFNDKSIWTTYPVGESKSAM